MRVWLRASTRQADHQNETRCPAVYWSAAFTALLVAGVVVSSWMAVRASRAEQEARAVNAFLQDDLLAQASASKQARSDTKPDPNLTVRTALDRAAATIAGKFERQPLVEASIRQTIGNTSPALPSRQIREP